MLIPIRCFTCGKPIGHLWEDFQKKVAAGDEPEKALDSLKINRYCCRRMIISNREYIDEIMRYRFK